MSSKIIKCSENLSTYFQQIEDYIFGLFPAILNWCIFTGYKIEKVNIILLLYPTNYTFSNHINYISKNLKTL